MALVSYENSDSETEINVEQEINKEVLIKEVKKHIKIKIPHLSNYDIEENEPPKKIFKPNQNMSSGLFNILPSPIHKPPDKFSKFDAAIVKEKNLIPRTVKMGNQNNVTGDLEEEEIYERNYFFIDTASKTKNIPLPVSLNIEVNSAPVKKDMFKKTNAYFSKLVCKSAIKEIVSKQEGCDPNFPGDDKVVDINSAEFKKDWKMNALKEETSSASASSRSEQKEAEPSIVSRRKHQITYLAYQAKKNEEQLKEQWAMNKMTRKQTQARYGF